MDNREIDKLIAEKVMGWTQGPELADARKTQRLTHATYNDAYLTPEGKIASYIPKYSTDIAAATAIIEHFEQQNLTIAIWKKPGQDWHAIIAKDYQYFLEDHESGMASMDVSQADTLPMVICLAALKAVGAEIEVKE